MDELIIQNMALKQTIDDLKVQHPPTDVASVAIHIRKEIQDTKDDAPWPSDPLMTNVESVKLPDSLSQFLSAILTGECTPKHISETTRRIITSLGQDLIYNVHKGMFRPPKQILLSYAVKTLTGNVELIQILNRLGHGISYSKLMEIDTSLCLQKLALDPGNEAPLPRKTLQHVLASLGWDNIDRLEETLTGGGTSHRVNGIIVQPVVYGPQLPRPVRPTIDKSKIRSIRAEEIQLPLYNAGEKAGPPKRQLRAINYTDVLTDAKYQNLLWILARLHKEGCQSVSSWTGFNIQVHSANEVQENTIEYLPTINAPATEMSTVFEILLRSEKIRTSLQIPGIVCVFDQALYAKTAEIKWKHKDQFANVVLRMGTFHTICVLLAVIGKRFGDAGLRELAIETGVVEDGSIFGVLSGKKYNRAVRMHKLLYEAFNRLAWESFLDTVDNADFHNDLSILINELQQDLNHETFSGVMNTQVFIKAAALYEDHLRYLRKDNGDLSSFWMSYIDIVDIMLSMLRASREGNWKLHLASIQQLIPWCFAYDNTNYARYLSAYYLDMICVSEEHPEISEYMELGGFSVQIGTSNAFGRIPVDQTVEETVNKDTQTAGGTKGFSLNPGAIQRHYITAEYRTQFLRNIREMTCVKQSRGDHPDLHTPRIQKDEELVLAIVSLLTGTWINPFCPQTQELVSISSGLTVSEPIRADLLGAYEIVQVRYTEFNQRLYDKSLGVPKFHDKLARCNLKTFAHVRSKTSTVKTNRGEMVLRADRNLFAKSVLLAQYRKLDIQSVLRYPLGPLPWALATYNGLLRKTNKASLGNHLTKNVSVAEEIPRPSASMIDGMALVQRLKADNKTFSEIALLLLSQAVRESSGSCRIDMIFDVYRKDSIKNAERLVRGEGTGLRFTNIAAGHKVKQWREFLKNSQNKNNLITFVLQEWKREPLRQILGGTVLYVTCGQDCFKLTKEAAIVVPELESTHEEADTRLLLHAAHASESNKFRAIVIHSEDTDVRLLSLANVHQITTPMFQKSNHKKTYYIH